MAMGGSSMRPKSILLFERLYLSSVAISLLEVAISWKGSVALLQVALDLSVTAISLIIIAVFAISTAISLALWYFAARRSANIARWILAIFVGWSAVTWPFSIPRVITGLISPLAWSTNSVQIGLATAAVVMLFRADARTWFKGESVDLTVFR